MKSWLKGGLIAVAVFVVAFVVFFVASENLALLIMLVFFLGGNPMNPLLIIGYFVIGAVIGWLVGKKKKN